MSRDEYRYKELYALTVEVFDSLMDREGGDMILLAMCELLQEYLLEGNVPAAEAVAIKLCEISQTLYEEPDGISTEEKAIWLDLFWEFLCEEFNETD